MSQPKFPIPPDITRDDALNMLLASIAMEELGLSHIINAEGEKLQYVLGTLPGVESPSATIDDVLAANESVRGVLDSAVQNQLFLNAKMKSALNASVLQGPPGPTGPAPIAAYGGLYQDTAAMLELTESVEAVVGLGATMPSANVTPGTNNITIEVAGDYQVNFMLLLQSTSGDFGLSAGVRINGTFAEPALLAAIVLTSDFEVVTISSIVTLAEDDVLDLALFSATGGNVLFGPDLNASLSAVLLGSGT